RGAHLVRAGVARERNASSGEDRKCRGKKGGALHRGSPPPLWRCSCDGGFGVPPADFAASSTAEGAGASNSFCRCVDAGCVRAIDEFDVGGAIASGAD